VKWYAAMACQTRSLLDGLVVGETDCTRTTEKTHNNVNIKQKKSENNLIFIFSGEIISLTKQSSSPTHKCSVW
jgi:hypothetical protein